MVRMIGALLALAILIDFVFTYWKSAGPAFSLLPALIGALVSLGLSLREAASRRHRRILAAGMVLLTISLAVSLGLVLGSHVFGQAIVVALFLGGAFWLAVRALIASNRRRLHPFHHYYSGYAPD